MTKVLIYRPHGRRECAGVGACGAEYCMAFNWEDLSERVKEEDPSMVILDSVPSHATPLLTKRIRKIKDIPVIYLEEGFHRDSDPGAGDKGMPVQHWSTDTPPGASYMSSWQKSASAQRNALFDQQEDPLETARRFMDDNFRSPLSLARIAAVAGISPSYFCRKFKGRFQVSPVTYLRSLRMDRACYLLEHTDLRLSRVAEQSGFFSIPYFCREFRKVNGASPIQHRKRVRAKKRRGRRA